MSTPLEQDYIGLSQIPSMEKRSSQNPTEINRTNTLLLNLKETELRLGLPGSDSPSHTELKPVSVKNFVSGAKRGFSHSDLFNSVLLNNDKTELQNAVLDDKKTSPPNLPPAAKAQVVGWPPIRSFRKNTMATNNNVTKKPVAEIVAETNNSNNGCVFVKVSMDGAPYLRKVDLKTFSNYVQLSSALENMFTCFTIGQCSSHGVPGREGLTASRLMDIVNCSEYVLTYEDKDSDWMLVGDVPWEMFTNSCNRLRIMKGSEAIGLAPRAMEKCKNQK